MKKCHSSQVPASPNSRVTFGYHHYLCPPGTIYRTCSLHVVLIAPVSLLISSERLSFSLSKYRSQKLQMKAQCYISQKHNTKKKKRGCAYQGVHFRLPNREVPCVLGDSDSNPVFLIWRLPVSILARFH